MPSILPEIAEAENTLLLRQLLEIVFRHALSVSVANAPRRTRTYNPLIKSQRGFASPGKRKSKSAKCLTWAPSPQDGPLAHHLPTDTCQTDPDLAAVVAAWSKLPEETKATIRTLVLALEACLGKG
jgi:hypothetical protein